MSNIIQFEKAGRAIKDKRRLNALDGAGLDSTDIAIFSAATNRAFSETIPRIDEVSEIGFDRLQHLYITHKEIDEGDAYFLGNKETFTLSYFRAHNGFSRNWNQMSGEGFDLTQHEDPALFVVNHLLDSLAIEGIEVVGLYGIFAYDSYFFACNSVFEPLHFHYTPATKEALLLLRDPNRDVEVVLRSVLSTWVPSEEDMAGPEIKMNPNESKDKSEL